MSVDIIAAVVGGFLAWAFIGIATILIRRNRLSSYLHVVFELHFAEARDNGHWLEKVLAELAAGRGVAAPPRYTKNPLSDLDQVRESAIALLTKREMRRVAKCHSVLWELEALMEGFCSSLHDLERLRITGKTGDVNHLQRRGDRILALVRILPVRTRNIGDLPDDYDGRISAVTLGAPLTKP